MVAESLTKEYETKKSSFRHCFQYSYEKDAVSRRQLTVRLKWSSPWTWFTFTTIVCKYCEYHRWNEIRKAVVKNIVLKETVIIINESTTINGKLVRVTCLRTAVALSRVTQSLYCDLQHVKYGDNAKSACDTFSEFLREICFFYREVPKRKLDIICI
jgi:hypothetical protein